MNLLNNGGKNFFIYNFFLHWSKVVVSWFIFLLLKNIFTKNRLINIHMFKKYAIFKIYVFNNIFKFNLKYIEITFY